MGTVKEVVDLVTQLANSVQDRRIASELNAIQSLLLRLQSEQATLHEKNIELREKQSSLKEENRGLKAKIQELSSMSTTVPSGVPVCPNCSTSSKPYYMSPLDPNWAHILNATHECKKCDYNVRIQ